MVRPSSKISPGLVTTFWSGGSECSEAMSPHSEAACKELLAHLLRNPFTSVLTFPARFGDHLLARAVLFASGHGARTSRDLENGEGA